VKLLRADICGQIPRVKLFYTGPVVNAEMLVVTLEEHRITERCSPARHPTSQPLPASPRRFPFVKL
jgi:hypothetical protein